MRPLRRLSVADQTADALREAVSCRRWGDSVPGVSRVAADLQVSRDNARAAMRRLEEEGTLEAAGPGRPRKIVGDVKQGTQRSLRVGILLFAKLTSTPSGMQRSILSARHNLEQAGHRCFYASKSQLELGLDADWITDMVSKSLADVWIVVAARFDVVGWFERQSFTTIAWGDHHSPHEVLRVTVDYASYITQVTRRLIGLGHRRIVMLSSPVWRKPVLSHSILAFQEELTKSGITPSSYHLPDWEPTPAALHELLKETFKHTPPTALIITMPSFVMGVLSFLCEKELKVPTNVSIATIMEDEVLDWFHPPLTGVRCDLEVGVQRILRWVDALARGGRPKGTITLPYEIIEGESLAPPFRGK